MPATDQRDERFVDTTEVRSCAPDARRASEPQQPLHLKADVQRKCDFLHTSAHEGATHRSANRTQTRSSLPLPARSESEIPIQSGPRLEEGPNLPLPAHAGRQYVENA